MASKTYIGNRDILTEKLGTFNRTYHPDEIIVSGYIYDFTARLHSQEIAAEVISELE